MGFFSLCIGCTWLRVYTLCGTMTPYKMNILVKLSLALPLLPNLGDNLKWDQRVRQLTECDLLLSLYFLPLSIAWRSSTSTIREGRYWPILPTPGVVYDVSWFFERFVEVTSPMPRWQEASVFQISFVLHHTYCWEGVQWMNMQFPGLLVHIWVVFYLELLGIMALWIRPFFRMFATATAWFQDSHGFMHALVQRMPESIALRNGHKVRLWFQLCCSCQS